MAFVSLDRLPFSQESPRQTKPKKGPKRKVHEFRPFLWILVFFLRKTSTIHISNFSSGAPLRQVHELTFLWFGLPGPLLIFVPFSWLCHGPFLGKFYAYSQMAAEIAMLSSLRMRLLRLQLRSFWGAVRPNWIVTTRETTYTVRTENDYNLHSWASAPNSGFSCGPVMGSNFLTPGHRGVRLGNVRRKFGPKRLCLCCFSFPEKSVLLLCSEFTTHSDSLLKI